VAWRRGLLLIVHAQLPHPALPLCLLHLCIDAPCAHCLRHGDPMHAQEKQKATHLRPLCQQQLLPQPRHLLLWGEGGRGRAIPPPPTPVFPFLRLIMGGELFSLPPLFASPQSQRGRDTRAAAAAAAAALRGVGGGPELPRT
jgi:hypothetical protein